MTTLKQLTVVNLQVKKSSCIRASSELQCDIYITVRVLDQATSGVSRKALLTLCHGEKVDYR